MPTAPAKHQPHKSPPTAAAPRLTAHQRGYTRRWNAYSKDRLRTHPVCVRCNELAEVTDHVQPHDGPDDPRFWDLENHQSLCKQCHDRKTTTEDRGFGLRRSNRFVIWGPPGSGKTTWARQQAAPGDLIWDLDDVADCLFALPHYPRPTHHAALLRSLRDWLLTRVCTDAFPGRVFVILSDHAGAAELARSMHARLIQATRPASINHEEPYTFV